MEIVSTSASLFPGRIHREPANVEGSQQMFGSKARFIGSRGTSVRRAVGGRLLALALAPMISVGSLAVSASSVQAATGVGIGYAAEVVCDMFTNTVQVRARAEAAAGLDVQDIQARFQVDRLVNGVWVTQPMDGYYSATGWLQFRHYRWYSGIYSPSASPDWLLLPMAGSDGIFRVKTQYRFYYGGWTAPTIWVTTQSYTVRTYQGMYPACFL
jgi:hypothetical protein